MSGAAGRALPGNRWDLLDGVEPASPPTVSVIVAHYRQPEQLARTLQALRRQTHPRDLLQIIVADDGSPEVPVVGDDVLLRRHDDRGFRLAAARNLGVEAASGEVLVFIDADTAPEPDFISRLTRLPALAPDAVTVGRRRHARFDGVPVDQAIERAVIGRELDEPAWLRAAYAVSRNLLDADDRSYRHVIGAVMCCSRALFEEVGGFDETFTSYGGEDWEWAYRAWIAGAVLAHVPDAVAWHDGPDFAGRSDGDRAQQNAEHIRLASLIPVPGSGARGLRREKVDIAVTGPAAPATEGQRFASIDGVLAAIPGAEVAASGANDARTEAARHDRVRLRIDIIRPVRVLPGGLNAAVARVSTDQLGELVIVDGAGNDLIRIVSMRARARILRWKRDDLFPSVRATCAGVHTRHEEVNVSAYLGGWE